MNIQKIKEKAQQVLNMNKPQYMRILLMIALLELIPNLLNIGEDILSNLLYIIISIAFMAVSHGYIVSSLKMVRNQSMMLANDDAFVGFKRFKELFSTYLLKNIFTVVPSMIMVLISSIFLGLFIAGASSGLSSQAVLSNDYTQIISSVANLPASVLGAFMLVYLIIVILIVVISSYLFAVSYLLERYHMTNMNAIKESFRLMKGHIWDVIKLELSFLGWMVLVILVQSVIGELLAFLPILGSLIASIIASVVGVYTYLPRYHLSKAIFFEELAYYRYEQTN